MRWMPVLMIGGFLFATGCSNPCQRVCVRMSAYAEECGFKIPEAEVDSCLDNNVSSKLAQEDIDTCRDFGDAEMIRKQWECEDLEAYWGVAPAATR